MDTVIYPKCNLQRIPRSILSRTSEQLSVALLRRQFFFISGSDSSCGHIHFTVIRAFQRDLFNLDGSKIRNYLVSFIDLQRAAGDTCLGCAPRLWKEQAKRDQVIEYSLRLRAKGTIYLKSVYSCMNHTVLLDTWPLQLIDNYVHWSDRDPYLSGFFCRCWKLYRECRWGWSSHFWWENQGEEGVIQVTKWPRIPILSFVTLFHSSFLVWYSSLLSIPYIFTESDAFRVIK